jgi:uncharacterized protein
MPVTLLDVRTPGTYVTEDAAGFIPVEIASFARTYIFGVAAGAATTTRNLPFQVTGVDDFTNQFGVSAGSLPSIQAFFNNNPVGVLNFINVLKAGATATVAEWVTAIGAAIDDDTPIGILIAPEAFQTLTTAIDRLAICNKLRDMAEIHRMVVFADSGPATTTSSAAIVEAATYTTARGHVAYYTPYLKDLNSVTIPPSAAIAGLATRRYREQGFQEPPAGAQFPIRGVLDVVTRYKGIDQETMNPAGVNVIRNLKNKGIVTWGARTRSSNPYFRFINTRVILNVLEETLEPAFDYMIFNSIRGETFTRIKETINVVCYRLWKAGALYGNTPSDAFGVICNDANNPAIDLESGILRADVWVVPAPTLERLFIQVNRTTIGSVSAELSKYKV